MYSKVEDSWDIAELRVCLALCTVIGLPNKKHSRLIGANVLVALTTIAKPREGHKVGLVLVAHHNRDLRLCLYRHLLLKNDVDHALFQVNIRLLEHS